MLFTEHAEGSTRVNLRSSGEIDVCKIAQNFGGGGHIAAAGITSDLALDELKEKILEQAKAALS